MRRTMPQWKSLFPMEEKIISEIENIYIIGAGDHAKVIADIFVNTNLVVEHDNKIADHVHLSPNAVTGGTVVIGEGTHIGIGAIVKNNIYVAAGCQVGAGAVVVRDITVLGTYIGVPARRL